MQYETVNILEDEGLRQGMKVYSSWPTFPQVYVAGEFYGGCDICIGASRPFLPSSAKANPPHTLWIPPPSFLILPRLCFFTRSDVYALSLPPPVK